MSDIILGYLLAGFSFGMLVGVMLSKSIALYRKRRGWDD